VGVRDIRMPGCVELPREKQFFGGDMIKSEGKWVGKLGGKLALGASVLAMLGWTGVSRGQVISWEEDVYGTVPSNGYAGVVSVDNWTDSYPANQITNLPDNTGAATTLDL
jgi:hypothetical protein